MTTKILIYKLFRPTKSCAIFIPRNNRNNETLYFVRRISGISTEIVLKSHQRRHVKIFCLCYWEKYSELPGDETGYKVHE